MGNCLLTQLKNEVQNDNLMKLHEFAINVKEASNAFGSFVWNDGTTISTGITAKGVTITTSASSVTVNGNGNIYVEKKENLTSCVLENTAFTPDIKDFYYCSAIDILSLISNKMSAIQMSDLNSLPNSLTSLKIKFDINSGIGNKITGNISDLRIFPNITTLWLENQSEFSGNFGELADKFPNVTSLGFLSSWIINGSIEDFVAKCVSSGRTTSSVITNYGKYSLIQFKGETATGGMSTPFAWEPYSGNTKITYNNEETVIAVANDGTWTRVS